ncbi:uncharacterized protein LOC104433649 isoform X2 [Eucalyptus grandis]|uniref:uncharacterized protein LOC104433649 isoform X2 n=1 Tax=Eucalyptus grandis TaxID=71139 RepID=UPI00192EA9C7|nr:uncharacterized protein LOC104433649 isoform X2 [Eucalyptus grandis]
MADPHAAAEEPPVLAPLLVQDQSRGNHRPPPPPPPPPPHHHRRRREEEDVDPHLDQALHKLEMFLSFLGFNQSTVLSTVLSWTAFVVIGVVLPVIVLELSDCSDCDKYQIKNFELDIVASQACLAAVSLLCLSHNLRKYGMRKFLFVDRYSGQMSRFRDEYIKQIKVSTIVQVVGISLCLHAATRISHRAQGVASIASKWHALMTCSSTGTASLRGSDNVGSMEPMNAFGSIHTDFSESDLESLEYIGMPTSTQLATYMSTYHKRQALVMYLQTNPGGITLYGWTVDRALINTIFFIELSLVTFVLGKTIVFSSS